MAEDPDSKGIGEEPRAGEDALPDTVRRQQFLQQIADKVATLEAEIYQACPAPHNAPSGGNKLGARKDAAFKAICTAPSINWTPAGATQVPVPYQTVQDLSNSTNTAQTVRFNGQPAYLLDQTTQPKGTGDERGTGKGIRSGTVTGEVKPVSGCGTVRIEGKQVVREGDLCTMNGGNNPGQYIASSVTSGSSPITTGARLAAVSETSRELRLFQKLSLSGTATTFTCPLPSRAAASLQKLAPWDKNAEELQKTKTLNSLSIALLGYHGIWGALSRLIGQDEDTVAKATAVGVSTIGLEAAVTGSTAQPHVAVTNTRNSSHTGLKVRRQSANDAQPDATLYHLTTSPSRAHSVLGGIDSKYFDPESRFGPAFYMAADSRTAIAEIAYHEQIATTAIRYEVDTTAIRVLDLTNPIIAKQYGYQGGNALPETRKIGEIAASKGYNAIKFKSERADGNNYAILTDHNKILKPVGVSPIK